LVRFLRLSRIYFKSGFEEKIEKRVKGTNITMFAVFVKLCLIGLLLQYFMGVVPVVKEIQPHLVKQEIGRQKAHKYNMVSALAHVTLANINR